MKPLSILTSVLIVVPATALIWKGVDLIRFESAEAAIQSLVERAPGRNSHRLAVRRELNEMIREATNWSSSPGAAGPARQTIGPLEEAKGHGKSARRDTRPDAPLRERAEADRPREGALSDDMTRPDTAPGGLGGEGWTLLDVQRAEPDAALENVISFADDRRLARLESVMTDLLAARPSDGVHWVELAKLRLQRGASLTQVLSALEMAVVTEGHERATMAALVPVWLALWEDLPDSWKQVAINQLVDLNGDFRPGAERQLKAILAQKSPETHEALRDAIEARGAPLQPWMKAIGF
jgi:hypothetical protein